MKLVLTGLVMIALGMNGSETDSDWVSDSQVDADFHVGPSTIPNKKRNGPVIQSSLSKKQKPDTGKISVGKDASGLLLYMCDRCGKIGHFDTIANHMHSISGNCFVQDGLPCLHCKDGSKLYKAVAMLEHNKQLHANLASWRCRLCGTASEKGDWLSHLAFYTNIKNAPIVFEGWRNKNLKIAKNKSTLRNAEKKLNRKRQKSAPENTIDQLEQISEIVLVGLLNQNK